MDSAEMRRLSLGIRKTPWRQQMRRLERFVAQILGFEGWRVVEWYWETPDRLKFMPISWELVPRGARLVIVVGRRWMGRCVDCGHRCAKVHEHLKVRRWHDLPWCEHPVDIEYAPDRLWCPCCERSCVELLPWADRYQHETRRAQQYIALEAQSMPTSHVAVRYGVDWHTVRRAERRALERWDATRTPPPLTQVGMDEKYLGRRNQFGDKFVTIVSNLESGEPVWIGFGRREATVNAWINTLSVHDKTAIKLVVMDMHQPFKLAVQADDALRHAAIAHDPFHVMKRANEAIDELRRETFFRAGPHMRALGRGKCWLFRRAWAKCTDDDHVELRSLLRGNPKLAHGYQVREELRDVLHAPNELTMAMGLVHVMKRIERRDNVPMRKLHDSLDAHFDEIVALGGHHPPTGRIEALNNNWETLVRQGRGYRDLDFLLLKLRFAVVNPIRTENGAKRFLALGLPAPYRTAAAA